MSAPKRDQNLFNYEAPSFSKPRTQPLEVMLVGLSRTGTSCKHPSPKHEELEIR